jgi:hypothetical protein
MLKLVDAVLAESVAWGIAAAEAAISASLRIRGCPVVSAAETPPCGAVASVNSSLLHASGLSTSPTNNGRRSRPRL